MVSFRALTRLVVLGIAAIAGGCSSSPYDSDYAARLADFRGDSVFAALALEPLDLAAGRVRLRVPRQFAPPREDDRDEAAIRARPPFLAAIPQVQAAVEVMVNKEYTEYWPAVLTICVDAAADRPLVALKDAILRQAQVQDREAAWTPTTVRPLAGGPASWDAMVVRKDQPFSIQNNSQYVDKSLPGICVVWVSSEPKQEFCTVLVLRVPQEIAERLELPPEQLVELVARTVQIVPPQPADQPPN